MGIAAFMGFPHFGGVNLVQPVIFGEKFPHVIVQPIDAFLRVGVFANPPVLVTEIIGKHIDGGPDQGIHITRPRTFFAVKDIGLRRFGVAAFNQRAFDHVLNAFHIGKSVGIGGLNLKNDLIAQRLGQLIIVPSACGGRLENRHGDLFRTEFFDTPIAFTNAIDQRSSPPATTGHHVATFSLLLP